jgi:Tol biopolymer transport system component
MKKIIAIAIVLTLGTTVEVANADFTFGTPTNLGPTVNSSANDPGPSISADGLSLFFTSNRSGGQGNLDLWVTTRTSVSDPWGPPVNLGPTVNSLSTDGVPSISADGLELYFTSDRPGGRGNSDTWVTTRETVSEPWGAPVNLGSPVNSSSADFAPAISPDDLELYFCSQRTGGYSGDEIWVTRRDAKDAPWSEPVNLGPTVNSPNLDATGSISSDGLALFFQSNRSGGYGGPVDIWVTTRQTKDADWGTPVNLGPTINTSGFDGNPSISADGSTLYFASNRNGGYGGNDLWQVSIDPVVDLNGDGIVDALDMCIIVDHWGTDEPLCDVGPMPWGDGVVDVQDLIVLAEHLFEEIPPAQ